MNEVRISDVTMKQVGKGFSLTFKEKLELSKLLDKLGAAIIEVEGIQQAKIDSLRVKSIATAVKRSIVAVPVELDRERAADLERFEGGPPSQTAGGGFCQPRPDGVHFPQEAGRHAGRHPGYRFRLL